MADGDVDAQPSSYPAVWRSPLAGEFVAFESRCCPFIRFTLEVEAEGGAVHLRLGGRPGVTGGRNVASPTHSCTLRVNEVRVFYDVPETTVEIVAIIPKEEAEAWLAEEARKPS